MSTDLDLLAERVERAAQLVHDMRTERDALRQRLAEAEKKLNGQDLGALLAEVQALRKEQRAWHSERREVASRIEALADKLERLES